MQLSGFANMLILVYFRCKPISGLDKISFYLNQFKMKKVLLILVLFFACKNTTAIAQGVPDTLQYLNTIVQNKSQYIGQPFSKLLADLKIEIIYFNSLAF